MTEDLRELEARGKRLAEATAQLRPRPGFNDQVLRLIAAEASAPRLSGANWLGSVTHLGRVALAAAALTAALTITWAVQSEQSFNTALAASFGEDEEVDW